MTGMIREKSPERLGAGIFREPWWVMVQKKARGSAGRVSRIFFRPFQTGDVQHGSLSLITLPWVQSIMLEQAGNNSM
jgi:hypothetical protein